MCASVFLAPTAKRMIPVTMGMCRYVNESRAIRTRSSDGAERSRRAAAMATKSKYAHHIQPATTMPTSAATMSPASRSRPAVPTPTATIDSPRAMITISPWRSARCDAFTRQPATPRTSSPT